jgi:hypothetical protein
VTSSIEFKVLYFKWFFGSGGVVLLREWQAVCSFNQINRVLLKNVSFSNKLGLLGNKPGLLQPMGFLKET